MSWGFRDWLRWVVGAAAMPLMGSAAIFACAGWASSAVRPPQRFLVSLLVVFVASIVIWMAVSAMEITPRRLKSVEHPAMYPSEAITFFGAPLLTAVLLTLARRFGGSNPSSRSTNA